MVAPEAGAVVLVPFPFSDLSRSKLRPAIVLANAGRGDWILCQVTSNPYGDPNAVSISGKSFAKGGLKIDSFARPGKIFTGSGDLMVGRAGTLTEDALEQVVLGVIHLLRGGHEPS